MKILVLDNYDSFVFNLVHIIRELGYADKMDVYRNDKISLERVADYDKILLSPGPGIPAEAGIMMELIGKYQGQKDMFGVCLGHQALAEAFGAKLHNMEEVLHGIDEDVTVTQRSDIFDRVPEKFRVCRYHSWIVDQDSVPNDLEVTAVDTIGRVMAIKHRELPLRGVQFHPESVMTEHGKEMLKNWLKE